MSPNLYSPEGGGASGAWGRHQRGEMLWDSCVQPYIVSAEEWTNLTAEAPVPTEDRAVDHPWPRVAPEVVPQGDGGRFVEFV